VRWRPRWASGISPPQIVAPALTAPLVAAIDARHAGAGPRVALLLVIAEFALGAALLRLIPRSALDAAPDARAER
jgi:hypothetical protein